MGLIAALPRAAVESANRRQRPDEPTVEIQAGNDDSVS